MKLNPYDKLRIAKFKALNPDVSHQDLADLLEVSRTTITAALDPLRLPSFLQSNDRNGRRRWINDTWTIYLAGLKEFEKELPF